MSNQDVHILDQMAPAMAIHPLLRHPMLQYLLDAGVPQDTLMQARAAGLNWPAILNMLLQYGLPALIAFLQSLLAPKPVPPVPPAPPK